MANSKQARKRARQALKSRAHNMSRRSTMRTLIKRVLEAVEKGDKQLAGEAFVRASSALDKAVKIGLIHKNKAARHKRNLSAKLKAIGASPVVKKKATEKKSDTKTPAKKVADQKESKTADKKPTAKKESKPAAKKPATEKKPVAEKKATKEKQS